LPAPEDYDQEISRLQQLCKAQQDQGRQIVVVMGVGFVGAVMAGVVADAWNKDTNDSPYFVIGMQRPSPRSFWKIPMLNRGLAPVEAEDPEVAPLISRCVLEKQTLTASFAYEALGLADIVVVDVQCDYLKDRLGNVREGNVEIAALEDSLKVIGAHIRPDCLVLIETTVPPGTTEYVAYPLIKKAFAKRGITDVEPLLAHSYERVMPGRDYVKSIRDFWRVCSGINDTRALHVAELVRDALRNMGRIVAASRIALLGASYREDVGDTRYSGSELVVRKLTEMGGDLVIHDPYVTHWWELEKQDTYPSPGRSWSRFFRNQERLSDTQIQQDLSEALKDADCMILAVRHDAYMDLDPEQMVALSGKPMAVIDCFGILSDATIQHYIELGCEVKGLGRGHIKRIKDRIRKK
jgi:UDP-N-acetyl-D-mannosaminuronate dehydrogenase